MYFYAFFQTAVLINLLIPLRQAEAITWGNFVPAKRSLQYKWGILSYRVETFYMYSQDVIYEGFITLPESQQNGKEICSSNRDHVILAIDGLTVFNWNCFLMNFVVDWKLGILLLFKFYHVLLLALIFTYLVLKVHF